MDKSKMGSVKDVVEVVVIVVHLNGGELTFVDNVGRGQGTEVEGMLQAAATSAIIATGFAYILCDACLRRT